MKKLGFGCMRLPLCNPQDPTSVNQQELNQMVDAFMEAGFNYFDTAYLYHDEKSESSLKAALMDRYDRERFILADKMPTVIVKAAEEYPVYFQNQLERTGAGYFDYYLMHNMGKDRYETTKRFGGFEFARRMQEEGKIKKFGFSFHDDADTLDRILTEHPEVDFVQLQINYLDWENPIIQSGKCYETAVKHGKPVIVMEPVKGGILAKLPAEAEELMREWNPDASPVSYALRFAASLENVMMVLSGMSSLEQMKDNLKIMEEPGPLTAEERDMLKKVVAVIEKNTAVPCTSCGYCMEVCPKNIAIPKIFGLYNNYAVTGSFSGMYYKRATYNRGKASDCVQCHLCEKNCPQHIAIPEHLKKVAELE